MGARVGPRDQQLRVIGDSSPGPERKADTTTEDSEESIGRVRIRSGRCSVLVDQSAEPITSVHG